MDKNAINGAIPVDVLVARTTILSPRSTASKKNHQARKRRNWKEVIQGVLACLVIAALLDVVLINVLLFPDCNRDTRDCFLVQHLWVAK